MPMYACLLNERAIRNASADLHTETLTSRYPACIVEVDERRVPIDPVPDGHTPIHYFTAPDRLQADVYFKRMRETGCPRADFVGDALGDVNPSAKQWRWRGNLVPLRSRMVGMPFPATTDKRVQDNPQFRTVSRLLAQLCESYWKLRRVNGVAQFSNEQRKGFGDSFRKIEEEIAIATLVFAGLLEAAEEAYRAFGMSHERRFRLAVDEPLDEQPTESRPRRRERTADAKTVSASPNISSPQQAVAAR